mmetsp:Transcript_84527/g.236601  ORF Transcript_84527/g.236601 Transcript_84527/m.236601 type:complete len:383 (-) Transcript_84527:152-1300(-)|eukprot:CAMPEP_0176213156 /NCGR_PEP_ID=MMETSP0121_2-20121125/15514_1 /TAXON_ID=160619 /ORGANISM="Kryptoperidinium foliaceum, Strain CCMP 1326" /LENGTH=382 /DNA_ID=CAMNT_0017552211 /DNA_START=51 /DNA_END=1199 /DNA_ORIENTATION=+
MAFLPSPLYRLCCSEDRSLEPQHVYEEHRRRSPIFEEEPVEHGRWMGYAAARSIGASPHHAPARPTDTIPRCAGAWSHETARFASMRSSCAAPQYMAAHPGFCPQVFASSSFHGAPLSPGHGACEVPQVALGQSDAPSFDPAHGGEGQLVERPEVEIEGGARYRGQWLNMRRHGRGVLTRPDGQRYEGEFSDNRAHGRGLFQTTNGKTYDGEWEADRAHGYGKYVHMDGSSYEGEWRRDEKCGRGEETWADGSRYTGEFRFGSKHGEGAYTSAKGVAYEGQFRLDKMEGEGSYRFADGRVFRGQWRDGHMHGTGKMEWPNGSSYTGGYERDMKSGEGTFVWPDGRVYRGQWKSGKQHGHGKTVDSSGLESEGEWLNGERASF